ncbi:50S ribosomal protein L21e [Methanococcus aeolicus]|uniref:Large ribosomal subunit protein eL21 n=1 Tax=Methanococcus aeolicus (strain ATCC BAA-1280 / DSM 17508 / OCM 812 / Nankai-3) TaxID=419665 RepID=RL21_META3|nr:50S ribosomal protein L21e [Methanococcus aeolicus]A6UT27.1 RecName: Full=Large ribosomal subunit protein eL21; AltName: Full=50S ribosomal protein L21e [Methanococcus aeolicus Nankai-3]ABR55649.1 Ribosomal protein L21e [Methanococcus aeolicus Nankai-3]UXM85149.1 50S ribosomal protein L21e [Methanococcus aeolicus]
MQKSEGFRSGTRYKLKKHPRAKGLYPITRALKQFENGQTVHVILDPSVQKGMPHPKFHGKTGKIIGQRGSSFIVEVKDGHATKEIIARPQHLRECKN